MMNKLSKSTRNFGLGLLIGVFITACSVKTIYNQLDYIIPEYVEGMVSLDDVLEEKLEQRTLSLLNWHRQTQLKQYANWFRDLQNDVKGDLTEDKLSQHIDAISNFMNALQSKLNEEMAGLLPLLNETQRKELFSNIKENNEEFREENIELDNEERLEKYTENVINSYENWLGDLTEVQEGYIKQAAVNLKSTSVLRLESRKQWQQSIQKILDSDESRSNKEHQLRIYFQQYLDETNPDMKAIEDQNKSIFAGLTVNIVESMTEKQRAYFISKTNDYIRIFEELAENK